VGFEEFVSHVVFIALLIFCALIPCLVLAETLARYRARAARRGAMAEQRALALLKAWLSPAQLAQYERDGSFEVVGCHSGTRYRIRRAGHMNIDELSERGVRVAVWCFGPHGFLPVSDMMLAQKIALETDEQAALQVANCNYY
jgi:hypothetical protein